MSNIWKILSLTAVLALSAVAVALAAVPAPPVNQYIGIPDTVFGAMEEADCRVCHSANPPAGVPVDTTYLPDRHHNLVGTTISDPNSAPFGSAGQTFECTSCHNLVLVNNVFRFETFRDCNFCHTGGSPHHTTAEALMGDCVSCHGSLVDNGLLPENREVRNGVSVPVWLPTYSPSQITPWPSRKTNAGPNGEGSCFYCHAQSATAPISGGAPVMDPSSGVLVYSPADTHHSTTLASDTNKCGWCHRLGAGGVATAAPHPEAIRVCENCHGIPSLHNIQYDNRGTGIVPGQMDPWYGHIGASSDCFGCHGFTRTQSVAPMAGPIVPQIDAISRQVAIAGSATDVELVGLSFVNSYSPMAGIPAVEYSSVVEISNTEGLSFELAPRQISASTLQFTLPADVPAGNYKVVARKLDKASNPVGLVVKPAVAIDAAAIQADGSIRIAGTGFGVAPPLAEGLGVKVNNLAANVLSWSDQQIVVNAPAAQAGQTVQVLSTYVVSAQLTGAAAPPADDEPVRGGKGKAKKTDLKKVR